MRFEDFEVGAPFYTATGTWVCTDKGRRVIIAIKVDEHDPSWLEGPPYMVAESVFDEYDMGGCWLDDVTDQEERLRNAEEVQEVSIPHAVMMEGFQLRMGAENRSYPHPRLLRSARNQQGRILHPQAAVKGAHGWEIVVLTPEHTLTRMPEGQFLALPIVPRRASQRALAKQKES